MDTMKAMCIPGKKFPRSLESTMTATDDRNHPHCHPAISEPRNIPQQREVVD
jgi:hypothetical protein